MLINHIPSSEPACECCANDSKAPPTIEGTTNARIATERGTFFSMNHEASRDDAMATAPEGMFRSAASSLEYPNPAMSVAEKVVIAPLGREQHPAMRRTSQNARSEVSVERTCEKLKRRVDAVDLLDWRMRCARKVRSEAVRKEAVVGLSVR